MLRRAAGAASSAPCPVKRVIKSAKSQTVAGNYAKGLRGTCKRAVAAKGAAVKG